MQQTAGSTPNVVSLKVGTKILDAAYARNQPREPHQPDKASIPDCAPHRLAGLADVTESGHLPARILRGAKPAAGLHRRLSPGQYLPHEVSENPSYNQYDAALGRAARAGNLARLNVPGLVLNMSFGSAQQKSSAS